MGILLLLAVAACVGILIWVRPKKKTDTRGIKGGTVSGTISGEKTMQVVLPPPEPWVRIYMDRRRMDRFQCPYCEGENAFGTKACEVCGSRLT